MRLFRLCVALVMSVMLLGEFTGTALERPPSYQYDQNGISIPAPEAYKVDRVWYAQHAGIAALKNPTDIFVDSNNYLFIADTGNSRVLVFNSDWELISEIREVWKEEQKESLQDPQGVFKGTDGLLYICDTGNYRVIGVDEEGRIKREICGQDLIAVQNVYDFKPERVAVDSLGNIYVASSSVYQGIMRFSANDTFQSFFAPNEVERTLSTWLLSILKSFFTDEQKDATVKSLPQPYNNLYINKDFVYTTAAQAEEGKDLKKNNLMGINILQTGQSFASKGRFGDEERTIIDGKLSGTAFVDVHVDDQGIISVIDANTNRLYQYTQECDLIAIFGGSGSNKGQHLQAVAVEKMGDSYLVLDQQNGAVTVFSPSEYIMNIRKALQLYNRGLYAEAKSLWEEVLNENSNMILAYKGIGRSALQQNDFKKAMGYLDKGADKYFYSMSLKEFRKNFVRQYALILFVGVGGGLVAVWFSIRKLRRYLLSGGINNVKL